MHNLTIGEENVLECCGSKLLNPTVGRIYSIKVVNLENTSVLFIFSENLINAVQNQEVCCTGEEQSLFYPAKDGFQCCGHQYYDSTLWSCCVGKLSPVHHQITHIRPTPKGHCSAENMEPEKWNFSSQLLHFSDAIFFFSFFLQNPNFNW